MPFNTRISQLRLLTKCQTGRLEQQSAGWEPKIEVLGHHFFYAPSPWPIDGRLLWVPRHGLLPVRVCPHLIKDTGQIGVGPTLMTLFSLDDPFKGSLSKDSPMARY